MDTQSFFNQGITFLVSGDDETAQNYPGVCPGMMYEIFEVNRVHCMDDEPQLYSFYDNDNNERLTVSDLFDKDPSEPSLFPNSESSQETYNLSDNVNSDYKHAVLQVQSEHISTRDNSDCNASIDAEDDKEDPNFENDSTKSESSKADSDKKVKKARKPKKDRKQYLLRNGVDFILDNTIIKRLYDTIGEEGYCTFARLRSLYEKEQEDLRRTDGTCYSGDAARTVRGTLEANSFFQLADKKSKSEAQSLWTTVDEELATKFFDEQKAAIETHKKKYKKPLKKAITKDTNRSTRQRASNN